MDSYSTCYFVFVAFDQHVSEINSICCTYQYLLLLQKMFYRRPSVLVLITRYQRYPDKSVHNCISKDTMTAWGGFLSFSLSISPPFFSNPKYIHGIRKLKATFSVLAYD